MRNESDSLQWGIIIFSGKRLYCNIFFLTDSLICTSVVVAKIPQWHIVWTYPDQDLEGVDSVIYSPLNVIHQVVSGASDHHRRDGAVLFLCLKTNNNMLLSLKLIWSRNQKFKKLKPAENDLPCLKTTTWVSPTSVRYTLSQWPISSGVGAVWESRKESWYNGVFLFMVHVTYLIWRKHSPSGAALQLPQSYITSSGPTWS